MNLALRIRVTMTAAMLFLSMLAVGQANKSSFEKVAHDGSRWRSAFHLDKAGFHKSGSQAGKDRHGVFLFATRIDGIPFDDFRAALSSESDCGLQQLPG